MPQPYYQPPAMMAQPQPQLQPVSQPQPQPQPQTTASVISAAPVVRNLQKELTAMLPPNLLKRKARTSVAKPVRPVSNAGRAVVNAAPDVGGEESSPNKKIAIERPAAPSVAPKKVVPPGKTVKDEYADFMSSMKDLLG